MLRPGGRLLYVATTPGWLAPSFGSAPCHLADTAISSCTKYKLLVSHGRLKGELPRHVSVTLSLFAWRIDSGIYSTQHRLFLSHLVECPYLSSLRGLSARTLGPLLDAQQALAHHHDVGKLHE